MAIVHLGNVLQGTAYSSGLDTRIPWSALEYSGGTQVITGISGSAIGGNIDSATVSAIASSYVESGVSGKMDASASSQFAPSGDYYSATNPSGFVNSSYVASSISGKMDASASSDFYSTGNPSGFLTGVDLSDYVPISAVSSWSSDIQTLSAALSSLQTSLGDIYTLSAGNGLQISSNTSTKVTVIGML